MKKIISASKIMIAVGGKSYFPDFEGSQHMINSDKALDLDELPKSIVIYGSGYIAVEFAGIFSGFFGVDTSLVFRSDYLLRGFDIDIRKRLTEQIASSGVRIFPNSTIDYINKLGNRYKIKISSGDLIDCNLVMGATGRKPNTTDLGLNDVGVKMGKNSEIVVDEYNQSNIKSIYAIGDVTDRINLTPVAIAEGHAFSDRNLVIKIGLFLIKMFPVLFFSQPPVSVVGLSKEDAEEKRN